MDFFDLIKNRDFYLKKETIKSGKDLGISPNNLIYVEKEYDKEVNEYLSKNYNSISEKIFHYNKSMKLIYLPISFDDLFDNHGEILSLLKYYYPNIKIGGDYYDKVQDAISTSIFTNITFSFIGYSEIVTPGFLRFVKKTSIGQEYEYIYEYIKLDLISDISLKKQVKYCVEQFLDCMPPSGSGGSGGIYPSLFDESEEDDIYIPKKKTKGSGLIDDKSEKTYRKDEEISEEKASNDGSGLFAKRKLSSTSKNIFDKPFWHHLFDEDVDEDKKNKADLKSKPPSTEKTFGKIESIDEKPSCQLFEGSVEQFDEKYPAESPYAITLAEESNPKESELIARIKEDIITIKELGLLDLLIKELGPALFEDKEEIYKPSRLIMDDNFRIFLPDFDNMEIEMTPLPKTLFILFLRHTDGILLKHIHDYKDELLKIYKLLSYKEDFFDIVESINRICNPSDGSINEKISRIKEAFIKKMSIDTAKYYIITGERGQKKEIPLNRSLMQLPPMFEEIIMTGAR